MSDSNYKPSDPSVQLPVGFDDFGEIIEKKLNFVDKSFFIKEVLDDINNKVLVITRPRRFGKTLNLSMLEHFLAAEVEGKKTQGLFHNLKIWQAGDKYQQLQGKYPVISLTFKDIKDLNFNAASLTLSKILSHVYFQHRDLLLSPRLTDYQKKVFGSLLEARGSEANIKSSLLDLTQYLYLHYGVKPWLLIDEYDTPIHVAYANEYYKDMVALMRGLMDSVLKNNPYLDKAVITGILRVAKESLFSDVNNLEVFSVMQNEYSHHFGFTEEEVAAVLERARLLDKIDDAKAWYNGYLFGETIIYNPWSIANFIKRNGTTEPYWINTSDNQLIKDLLKTSPIEFKKNFETLITGGTVEKVIDEQMVFHYLDSTPSAVWSLLLMSGYLKQTSSIRTYRGTLCNLAIPNKEVSDLFRRIIEQWLSDRHGLEWYGEFIESLLVGRVDDFKKRLEDVMLQIVSCHDLAKEPEAFYHGLMLGFTVSLYKQYEIKSNRESGHGRFDIMLIPKDTTKLGIVIELKVKGETETLATAAKRALLQIEEKNYAVEFAARDIAKVLKIGIGFEKKTFDLCSDTYP